jgi:hypothetical protein
MYEGVPKVVRDFCNKCDYTATQKADFKMHANAILEGVYHPFSQLDYEETKSL